jgi:hypothetical protein
MSVDLPPLLPLDEADAMIRADHAEGGEKVHLTRAEARAIYYAIWDATHGLEPREHTLEDLNRLQLAQSEIGRVGWP